MNLKIDPARSVPTEVSPAAPLRYTTGIFVRAQDTYGGFRNVDIACLDRGSLIEWLRSRGGKNVWAENVVLTLLGHEQIVEES